MFFDAWVSSANHAHVTKLKLKKCLWGVNVKLQGENAENFPYVLACGRNITESVATTPYGVKKITPVSRCHVIFHN